MDALNILEAQNEENSDFEEDENDITLTAAANKSLDLSRSLTDQCSKLAELVMDDFLLPDVADHPDEEEVLKEVHIFHRPGTPDTEMKQVRRKKVVNEILETEKSYCEGLWLLLNHFIDSIRRSRLVSEDDLKTMFSSSLEDIYKSHCDLLQSLEIRVINWSAGSFVGDIFSDVFKSHNCPLFQQYQTYMNGFSASLLKINKTYNNNPEFYNLMRLLEEDKQCNRLNISSFLLTPVQRIPRYVLLLKQLLKYTSPDHIDSELISGSLKELASFLTRLNSSIEHSINLVNLNSSVKPRKKFGLSLSFRLNIQPAKKLQRQLSSRQNCIQSSSANFDPKTSTPMKKMDISKESSFEESLQANDEHNQEASNKASLKSICTYEESPDVNSRAAEQMSEEPKNTDEEVSTSRLPSNLMQQTITNKNDFKSHLFSMRKRADSKVRKGPITASHNVPVFGSTSQPKPIKRTMSGGSSGSKKKWTKRFKPSHENIPAYDEVDTTNVSSKKRSFKDSLKGLLKFKSFPTIPRSQTSSTSLTSTFFDKLSTDT